MLLASVYVPVAASVAPALIRLGSAWELLRSRVKLETAGGKLLSIPPEVVGHRRAGRPPDQQDRVRQARPRVRLQVLLRGAPAARATFRRSSTGSSARSTGHGRRPARSWWKPSRANGSMRCAVRSASRSFSLATCTAVPDSSWCSAPSGRSGDPTRTSSPSCWPCSGVG